jgi:hypothetical protein
MEIKMMMMMMMNKEMSVSIHNKPQYKWQSIGLGERTWRGGSCQPDRYGRMCVHSFLDLRAVVFNLLLMTLLSCILCN